MYQWHQRLQAAVDAADEKLRQGCTEDITLYAFASSMGYSPFHASRKFRQLAGISFREYLKGRKLAFALVEVRDSDHTLLEIAVRYGFSSHEAFTRAFKDAYGIAPAAYRAHPRPVVLRTKLGVFDRYLFGLGEIGMAASKKEIKIYYVSIPAHKFLHVKNYESDGYFDFWEKQEAYPGKDCDTICGLLNSIPGKLDGEDDENGSYSGQLLARLYEEGGRCPQAYGIRLPADYSGPVPENMLLIDIPDGEYIVFEHGAFDYEREGDSVYEALEAAIAGYRYEDCAPDHAPGRASYYYHAPKRYMKKVFPIERG